MSLLESDPSAVWRHSASSVPVRASELSFGSSNMSGNEHNGGGGFGDYGLVGYSPDAPRAMLFHGMNQGPNAGSAGAGDQVYALQNMIQNSCTPLQTYPALRRKGPAQGTGPAVNPLYKTELCRGWEETGMCRYGSKCQFAHGAHELRIVQRHRKYKTEACRTFAATGHCPYGLRCRFIHTAEDMQAHGSRGAFSGGLTRASAPVLPGTPLAAEAADRAVALSTLFSALSMSGDGVQGGGAGANVTIDDGGTALDDGVSGSALGAHDGLSVVADGSDGSLSPSRRGLASAPGTPTGATVATRAVRRAVPGSEGAAPRRLPIFARIAEDETR